MVTRESPAVLSVTFKAKHNGRYDDRLELVFQNTTSNKKFMIARTYRAAVGNRTNHVVLRPSAPYEPYDPLLRAPIRVLIPAIPLPALNLIPWRGRLPLNPIPDLLRRILTSNAQSRIDSDVQKHYMPGVLNEETHTKHFKALLWCEEFAMEYVDQLFCCHFGLSADSLFRQQMELYDMEKKKLHKHNQHYL